MTEPFALSVTATEALAEEGWLSPAGVEDKNAVSEAARLKIEDWAASIYFRKTL